MSKLLINEPPLQVLPSLAAAIGLNEAIFLQQLHYWIKRSGKPRDGRLWVHNTYDEWAAQFPFWSVPTIRRIVRSLRDQGLLQTTDRYNQSRIDRTPWYAINYEALDAIDAPPISRSADFDSRSDQIDQTSDEISSPPDQFDQTIRSERSDEPINVITSIYRTETTTETTEREREREREAAQTPPAPTPPSPAAPPVFEAEPEPPAPKPERRLAAAKTLRHASPHLDGARFGEDGRIPPGAGRNAVEVYYERFPITQNAARLDNLQEDDLIRACPDLERLRQVVTAYSRSSYRRGNLQLILDWYADPARYQPPTRAAPQAAQPRSKVQASLDAVDYVFDRLKQEQQEQSPHG